MSRCGRYFSFNESKTSTSGSVTIEAALILPVLLFLIYIILSILLSAYTALSDACDVLRNGWLEFDTSGPGEIMRIIRTVIETGEKIINGTQ